MWQIALEPKFHPLTSEHALHCNVCKLQCLQACRLHVAACSCNARLYSHPHQWHAPPLACNSRHALHHAHRHGMRSCGHQRGWCNWVDLAEHGLTRLHANLGGLVTSDRFRMDRQETMGCNHTDSIVTKVCWTTQMLQHIHVQRQTKHSPNRCMCVHIAPCEGKATCAAWGM